MKIPSQIEPHLPKQNNPKLCTFFLVYFELTTLFFLCLSFHCSCPFPRLIRHSSNIRSVSSLLILFLGLFVFILGFMELKSSFLFPNFWVLIGKFVGCVLVRFSDSFCFSIWGLNNLCSLIRCLNGASFPRDFSKSRGWSEIYDNNVIANTIKKLSSRWTKIHYPLSNIENRFMIIFWKRLPQCLVFWVQGKVHIFWEGHKILQNLHLTFD